MRLNIYQIFYSQETKKIIDDGFIPLDNTDNLRPDWREYWPIRNHLLNYSLDENAFYGFFSPKFKEKTGLTANECFQFVKSQSEDTDVISFSPYYDLSAYYQNSLIHAILQHPNSRFAIEGAVKMLTPSHQIAEIVMHSGNSIFCNFFVAKPKFWKTWLEKCELIWTESEANTTPIALVWNALDKTHDTPAAIKTFLIERVASLLLATNNSWKVKSYNPLNLPFSSASISKERSALLQMDSLKIAYCDQKRDEFLTLFKNVQDLVNKKLAKIN